MDYTLEITDANNCTSDTVNFMVNNLFINKKPFNGFYVYLTQHMKI